MGGHPCIDKQRRENHGAEATAVQFEGISSLPTQHIKRTGISKRSGYNYAELVFINGRS